MKDSVRARIDCRKDNELLVGENTNWRVQKLLLRAPQGTN
jgi:hypothetical protein